MMKQNVSPLLAEAFDAFTTKCFSCKKEYVVEQGIKWNPCPHCGKSLGEQMYSTEE